MSSVSESLPEDMRRLFAEIIGSADMALLHALETTERPTQAQRYAIMEIISTEFAAELQPDDEPTARGKLVDDLLGAFLLRWPIVSPGVGD